MNLRDSCGKCDHAAVTYNVVNCSLVMAAFTSCSVFDAPCVHQMPATSLESSDAADGGPRASRKVETGKFGGRVRDNILLSDVCFSSISPPHWRWAEYTLPLERLPRTLSHKLPASLVTPGDDIKRKYITILVPICYHSSTELVIEVVPGVQREALSTDP